MSREVFLVGTSHHFQIGGPLKSNRQNSEFKSFLKLICTFHSVGLLAEEMSLDALRKFDREQSTVAALAELLCVKHAYCDPSQDMQKKMRLCVERNQSVLLDFHGWSQERVDRAIAREHRRRESCWLAELLKHDESRVLFVCGSKHIESFHSLLKRHRTHVHLIAENWGDD